mgnify:CR=1 FL=1
MTQQVPIVNRYFASCESKIRLVGERCPNKVQQGRPPARRSKLARSPKKGGNQGLWWFFLPVSEFPSFP